MSAISAVPSGRRRLFVTTALPYANGPFHIGHIMEYIQADIWVRFQRMQGHEVHFVCADDTHGAAIMLKADAEGVTPQALVARIAATRPKHLDGFHISFDHWHSTDSPENVELSQDIYRRLRDRAPSLITTKPVEQFYDPVKGMFLPDRYIKGECPQCGAKDQYGDACEVCGAVYAPTDLKNPYSTHHRRDAGAQVVGALLLPALRSRVRRLPQGMDADAGAAAARGRQQGAGVARATRPREARGSPTGTSRATRRTSASRSRTHPGKYFYVWLDAPIGYLASLKAHLARQGIDFARVPAESRRRPVSTSSARTSSTSTRCSGRRC